MMDYARTVEQKENFMSRKPKMSKAEKLAFMREVHRRWKTIKGFPVDEPHVTEKELILAEDMLPDSE